MSVNKRFKVTFIGSKQLGLEVLRKMAELAPDSIQAIVTFDDTADKRSVLDAFVELSKKYGYPIYVLHKQSELLKCLSEVKPALCIVSNWYLILTKQILDLAPQGFLGLHASLLPSFRGNAPLVWALINGEQRTGITLFYFDEGMDTGDIVAQREFDIHELDTIKDLINKSITATSSIFDEVYIDLLLGNAPRRHQSKKGITYCGIRRPEDGIIDWKKSANAVHDFIRAQTIPYPCAFTLLEGKSLKVKSSRIFGVPFYGVPGTVSILNGEVVVACSEGAIIIDELVSGNGKVMKAISLLRCGNRLG